jgi:predicted nucleic acid-binding protein
MTNVACFDTGIFTVFLLKDCPPKVSAVMNRVQKGEIVAQVVAPIVSEVFYQVCKLDGREKAILLVNSLLEQYSIEIINPDRTLLFSAGLLKCQHRTALSYNDCQSIAYCLPRRIPFHTTEKKLKQIPGNVLQKLVIVKYELPKSEL